LQIVSDEWTSRRTVGRTKCPDLQLQSLTNLESSVDAVTQARFWAAAGKIEGWREALDGISRMLAASQAEYARIVATGEHKGSGDDPAREAE